MTEMTMTTKTTKGQIAMKPRKGVLVDAIWTIDLADFATRTTPGKEDLYSQKFEVATINSPATCWFLKMHLDAGEAVGLYLMADTERTKEVKHRAHFSFFVGDGSDSETLSDEDSPQLFSIEHSSSGWMEVTTRTRLFSLHLKEEKITITASIMVCSDQTEEFTHYFHGEKLAKLDSQQQMSNFVISCQGKDIVVCKELVMMGSPVLLAAMKDPSMNRLAITGFKYPVVKDMVDFLSTGDVAKNTDVPSLLKAAIKYWINVLKEVCIDRLMATLRQTVDIACQCFMLGDLCQVKELKNAAGEIICANYKHVETTMEWKAFIEGNFSLMKDLWTIAAKKVEMLEMEKK